MGTFVKVGPNRLVSGGAPHSGARLLVSNPIGKLERHTRRVGAGSRPRCNDVAIVLAVSSQIQLLARTSRVDFCYRACIDNLCTLAAVVARTGYPFRFGASTYRLKKFKTLFVSITFRLLSIEF